MWESKLVGCTDADGEPFGSSDGNVAVLDDLAAGAVITCSFTNSLKPTVKVIKTTSGVITAADFGFTLAGGNGGTKTVTASDTTSGSATWTELNVGGSYTIAEAVDPAFVMAFQGCVDTSAGLTTRIDAIDPESGSIRFTAAAGATIECSFSNSRRPSVTILKSVIGSPTGDQFQFTLEGLDGATVAAGQGTKTWDTTSTTPSVSWTNGLTPGGRYRLTEVGSSRWIPTFEQCIGTIDAAAVQNADGGISVTFTALAGTNIECRFVNSQVDSQPPPPSTTVPPVVQPVPPPTVGGLPSTGTDSDSILTLAGLLLALGVGAIMLRRRRVARSAD